MSMEKPNQHELAIEAYAEACSRLELAKKATDAARIEETAADKNMVEKWKIVAAKRDSGDIEPGIYRLARKGKLWAEGILIEENKSFPPVFPMWR